MKLQKPLISSAFYEKMRFPEKVSNGLTDILKIVALSWIEPDGISKFFLLNFDHLVGFFFTPSKGLMTQRTPPALAQRIESRLSNPSPWFESIESRPSHTALRRFKYRNSPVSPEAGSSFRKFGLLRVSASNNMSWEQHCQQNSQNGFSKIGRAVRLKDVVHISATLDSI